MFLNLGFYNLVALDRVTAIIKYGSNPSKNLRNNAIDQGKFIDVTENRGISALVVTNDGFVIASSVTSKVLGIERINKLEEYTKRNI
ncbi:hypothetical protein EUAN_22470 [Andreesenia angusta]|uniref:DUF370 domain-containing protein n=1 Tax=Andreesenia angusta TaxID=39480 RepID=A0A1S1V5L6_9FIRM|nr:DUF370 domain-containing protein [Andreesenia angusta]OHW61397.1 hypothetical protein EUAN_22470 [Andreesenia angusta]